MGLLQSRKMQSEWMILAQHVEIGVVVPIFVWIGEGSIYSDCVM